MTQDTNIFTSNEEDISTQDSEYTKNQIIPSFRQNYGLYQTLNQNQEMYNKDLTRECKKDLIKFINSSKPEFCSEILLLICEHARLSNEFVFNPNNIIIPYNGQQENSGVIFEIKRLPIPLRHILFKFKKYCIPEE